ncbi:MAG: radical SAM family heme chaperone HemW, partial [Actinomycetota bacterium]|nr:radical SAM family heme chaperone HemW [Actinomycetota bacterium]
MGISGDVFDLDRAFSGPQLPAHLYIHVPFCRTKCSYCDFYSTDEVSDINVEMVIRGIEAEIVRWHNAGLPGVLETVYLGGGTPTVITAGAVRLVRTALDRFPLRAGAEVTIEANPDSVTALLMEALAASGVTRVSLGVQSFAPTELAMLGRVHTVPEAISAARIIRASGFDLSVDLMCGIPGQTNASWTGSLEQALATGAQHISVYPLTLEEGTPLQVACDSGLVATPDPDAAADMMEIAEQLLGVRGLPRYEVANYAVPGHEARHNVAYWTGRSYMACGPAAHSMLDAETAYAVGMLTQADLDVGVARVRSAAPADMELWLTSGEMTTETLDAEEVAREDVMLGLRLTRGVSVAEVTRARLDDVMTDLSRLGLVERFS